MTLASVLPKSKAMKKDVKPPCTVTVEYVVYQQGHLIIFNMPKATERKAE